MWAKGPPFLRQISEIWKSDFNLQVVDEEAVPEKMASPPVRVNRMQLSDSSHGRRLGEAGGGHGPPWMGVHLGLLGAHLNWGPFRYYCRGPF